MKEQWPTPHSTGSLFSTATAVVYFPPVFSSSSI
jgi:hypothetical protein